MKLLTQKQTMKLATNWKHSLAAINTDGDTPDHWPVVKVFHPMSQACWLLSEYDPVHDVAFGLAYIHEPELGYVNLSDIRKARIFGLPFETDRHWKPVASLSSYCKVANALRRIPTNNEVENYRPTL